MEKEMDFSELGQNFTELSKEDLKQVSGGYAAMKCPSCGSYQIVTVSGGHKCLDCGKVF